MPLIESRSSEDIKLALGICYMRFDDVLWEFYSNENREDVKSLYKRLMEVNHEAFQCLNRDDLKSAAIYLEGVQEAFNEVQKKAGAPPNIDITKLKNK